MDSTFTLLTELAVDPFHQEAFAEEPAAFLRSAGFTGGGPAEFDHSLRATLRATPGWTPCVTGFDPGQDPSPDPDPPEIH